MVAALVLRIGGRIRILAQGVPIAGTLGPGPRGRPNFVISDYGEKYAVCCPICGDTEGKLFINSMYGQEVEGLNTRTLAKCFRRDCYSPWERKCALWDLIYGVRIPGLSGRIVTPQAVAEMQIAAPPEWVTDEARNAPLPGEFTQIDELPSDHPARKYLEGRGFDAAELAEKYDVAVVTQAYERYRTAQDRILIPIFRGDAMRAWQARAIPPRDGRLKYFTCPSARVSDLLYHLDEAAAYPWCVVVEGVTSVWRLGAPAVATFGSSISPVQLEELHRRWPRGVVFLHDLDVYPENDEQTARAAAKRKAAFESLRARCPESVILHLPGNTDPADYPRADMWRWIIHHATLGGLPPIRPPT